MPHSSGSKEVEEHNNKHVPVSIPIGLFFLSFYLLTFSTVKEVIFDRVHDLSQTGDVKRVIQAHNAHATAAIEAGALDPWSKESFFLYWCAFVAFLCSCATGYVSYFPII
jgi:hypothetical protein